MANRLKPRPEKLGALIDLVNCLPATGTIELALLRPLVIEAEISMVVDVERTLKVNPLFKKWFLTSDQTQWRQFNLEPLKQAVKPAELVHRRIKRLRLQKELTTFLKAKEPGAWQRWQNLYSAREYLLEVAVDLRRLTREFLEPWRLEDFPLYVPKQAKFLYLDPDGFLRAHQEQDLFFEALEREDFEPARIKVCARRRCPRLFWAGRITKSACSPECTNVLNARASQINRALREAEKDRKLKAAGQRND
jgi:hypothetical protein